MSNPIQAAAPPQADGWRGALSLRCERRGGRSVLARRVHSGPLLVQRPFYPEGDLCHVYLLHPPGGVVAGDDLSVTLDVAEQAGLLLTTPAAGKFYRSEAGRAVQRVMVKVAGGASLEWLPQETIYYQGARVHAVFEAELAAGAGFIGWDIAVLGRPAAGEGFAQGEVVLEWRISRDGSPLLRERLQLDAQAWQAKWGLAGHAVCGTLIASCADAGQLPWLQAQIENLPGCGVTLVEDLLVVRALEQRADRLRQWFTAIWRELRPAVVGRPACPPRIWAS